jgi:hypothetical protein
MVSYLDEDDILMQKAEKRGQKRRAYLEWCTHEAERVAECQRMLVVEDIRASTLRAYTNTIEAQLDSLPLEFPWQRNFALAAPNLPGDYSNFTEGTAEYVYGSGLHNEDEYEDLMEESRAAAAKAQEVQRLLDLEMEGDRQRLEREEKERLRKELR